MYVSILLNKVPRTEVGQAQNRKEAVRFDSFWFRTFRNLIGSVRFGSTGSVRFLVPSCKSLALGLLPSAGCRACRCLGLFTVASGSGKDKVGRSKGGFLTNSLFS